MARPPLQLSATPSIAVYNRSERIEGLAISLWGENPQSALAIGLVNGSTGESAGLSVGFLNYADSYTGLHWGVVNHASGNFDGWQGGFVLGLVGSVVNYAGGTMTGFQCGVINYAGTLRGLQLAIVNYAQSVEAGLQIGIVNIMPENRTFSNLPDELAPAMVIVNWHF